MVPRIDVKKCIFWRYFGRNALQVIDNKEIEKMIFEIRGKFVMLDSDIGSLYHVETRE